MLCLIKLFNGKLILVSEGSYFWDIFHKFLSLSYKRILGSLFKLLSLKALVSKCVEETSQTICFMFAKSAKYWAFQKTLYIRKNPLATPFIDSDVCKSESVEA